MDTWVLYNDHANVTLFDLVYSPAEDNLLVAALVAAASKTLYTAIKAQLEKNGGNGLAAQQLGGDKVQVRGAGRGYICVETPLLKAGATGSAYIFAHKLAADPRGASGDAFYVLPNGADLTQLFTERLRVACEFAVRPEWGEYLLEMGLEQNLVTDLPTFGQGSFFPRALRVEREGWKDIISGGLRDGALSFN